MSEKLYYVYGPDNTDMVADAVFTSRSERDEYASLRRVMQQYDVGSMKEIEEMIKFHRGPLVQ